MLSFFSPVITCFDEICISRSSLSESDSEESSESESESDSESSDSELLEHELEHPGCTAVF